MNFIFFFHLFIFASFAINCFSAESSIDDLIKAARSDNPKETLICSPDGAGGTILPKDIPKNLKNGMKLVLKKGRYDAGIVILSDNVLIEGENHPFIPAIVVKGKNCRVRNIYTVYFGTEKGLVTVDSIMVRVELDSGVESAVSVFGNCAIATISMRGKYNLSLKNCNLIDPRDKKMVCALNLKSDTCAFSAFNSVIYAKAFVLYSFSRASLRFEDCLLFGEQGLSSIEKSSFPDPKQIMIISDVNELKKIFKVIRTAGELIQRRPELNPPPSWNREWEGCGFVLKENLVNIGAKFDSEGYPDQSEAK